MWADVINEVRVQLAAAVSRAEAAEHKVCCSVLQQRGAVCCSSVLQCVAEYVSVWLCVAAR